MFGSKYLLSCKKAASICLCLAKKSNKANVITVLGVVNFNKENKYLFGKLLETRAQRRKKIRKVNNFKVTNVMKNAGIYMNSRGRVLLINVSVGSDVNCMVNFSNYYLVLSNEFTGKTDHCSSSQPMSSVCSSNLPFILSLCNKDNKSFGKESAISNVCEALENCASKVEIPFCQQLLTCIEPTQSMKNYYELYDEGGSVQGSGCKNSSHTVIETNKLSETEETHSVPENCSICSIFLTDDSELQICSSITLQSTSTYQLNYKPRVLASSMNLDNHENDYFLWKTEIEPTLGCCKISGSCLKHSLYEMCVSKSTECVCQHATSQSVEMTTPSFHDGFDTNDLSKRYSLDWVQFYPLSYNLFKKLKSSFNSCKFSKCGSNLDLILKRNYKCIEKRIIRSVGLSRKNYNSRTVKLNKHNFNSESTRKNIEHQNETFNELNVNDSTNLEGKPLGKLNCAVNPSTKANDLTRNKSEICGNRIENSGISKPNSCPENEYCNFKSYTSNNSEDKVDTYEKEMQASPSNEIFQHEMKIPAVYNKLDEDIEEVDKLSCCYRVSDFSESCNKICNDFVTKVANDSAINLILKNPSSKLENPNLRNDMNGTITNPLMMCEREINLRILRNKSVGPYFSSHRFIHKLKNVNPSSKQSPKQLFQQTDNENEFSFLKIVSPKSTRNSSFRSSPSIPLSQSKKQEDVSGSDSENLYSMRNESKDSLSSNSNKEAIGIQMATSSFSHSINSNSSTYNRYIDNYSSNVPPPIPNKPSSSQISTGDDQIYSKPNQCFSDGSLITSNKLNALLEKPENGLETSNSEYLYDISVGDYYCLKRLEVKDQPMNDVLNCFLGDAPSKTNQKNKEQNSYKDMIYQNMSKTKHFHSYNSSIHFDEFKDLQNKLEMNEHNSSVGDHHTFKMEESPFEYSNCSAPLSNTNIRDYKRENDSLKNKIRSFGIGNSGIKSKMKNEDERDHLNSIVNTRSEKYQNPIKFGVMNDNNLPGEIIRLNFVNSPFDGQSEKIKSDNKIRDWRISSGVFQNEYSVESNAENYSNLHSKRNYDKMKHFTGKRKRIKNVKRLGNELTNKPFSKNKPRMNAYYTKTQKVENTRFSYDRFNNVSLSPSKSVEDRMSFSYPKIEPKFTFKNHVNSLKPPYEPFLKFNSSSSGEELVQKEEVSKPTQNVEDTNLFVDMDGLPNNLKFNENSSLDFNKHKEDGIIVPSKVITENGKFTLDNPLHSIEIAEESQISKPNKKGDFAIYLDKFDADYFSVQSGKNASNSKMRVYDKLLMAKENPSTTISEKQIDEPGKGTNFESSISKLSEPVRHYSNSVKNYNEFETNSKDVSSNGKIDETQESNPLLRLNTNFYGRGGTKNIQNNFDVQNSSKVSTPEKIQLQNHQSEQIVPKKTQIQGHMLYPKNTECSDNVKVICEHQQCTKPSGKENSFVKIKNSFDENREKSRFNVCDELQNESKKQFPNESFGMFLKKNHEGSFANNPTKSIDENFENEIYFHSNQPNDDTENAENPAQLCSKVSIPNETRFSMSNGLNFKPPINKFNVIQPEEKSCIHNSDAQNPLTIEESHPFSIHQRPDEHVHQSLASEIQNCCNKFDNSIKSAYVHISPRNQDFNSRPGVETTNLMVDGNLKMQPESGINYFPDEEKNVYSSQCFLKNRKEATVHSNRMTDMLMNYATNGGGSSTNESVSVKGVSVNGLSNPDSKLDTKIKSHGSSSLPCENSNLSNECSYLNIEFKKRTHAFGFDNSEESLKMFTPKQYDMEFDNNLNRGAENITDFLYNYFTDRLQNNSYCIKSTENRKQLNETPNDTQSQSNKSTENDLVDGFSTSTVKLNNGIESHERNVTTDLCNLLFNIGQEIIQNSPCVKSDPGEIKSNETTDKFAEDLQNKFAGSKSVDNLELSSFEDINTSLKPINNIDNTIENIFIDKINGTHLSSINTPYYYSFIDDSFSHEKNCPNNESSKNTATPENAHSADKDSIEFCEKSIEGKTESNSLFINPICSKITKNKSTDNTDVHNDKFTGNCLKSPRNFNSELNCSDAAERVELVGRITSRIKENEIITHDLKSIVDFCLSLNIPNKANETAPEDESLVFDEFIRLSNKDKETENGIKNYFETFEWRTCLENNNNNQHRSDDNSHPLILSPQNNLENDCPLGNCNSSSCGMTRLFNQDESNSQKLFISNDREIGKRFTSNMVSQHDDAVEINLDCKNYDKKCSQKSHSDEEKFIRKAIYLKNNRITHDPSTKCTTSFNKNNCDCNIEHDSPTFANHETTLKDDVENYGNGDASSSSFYVNNEIHGNVKHNSHQIDGVNCKSSNDGNFVGNLINSIQVHSEHTLSKSEEISINNSSEMNQDESLGESILSDIQDVKSCIFQSTMNNPFVFAGIEIKDQTSFIEDPFHSYIDHRFNSVKDIADDLIDLDKSEKKLSSVENDSIINNVIDHEEIQKCLKPEYKLNSTKNNFLKNFEGLKIYDGKFCDNDMKTVDITGYSLTDDEEIIITDTFDEQVKTVDGNNSSTSTWNVSDRLKFRKFTKFLKESIIQRKAIDRKTRFAKYKVSNPKFSCWNKSDGLVDENVIRRMSDRDKFQAFSHFIREAIIERETIGKQAALLQLKTSTRTNISASFPRFQSSKVRETSTEEINVRINSTGTNKMEQSSMSSDVEEILDGRKKKFETKCKCDENLSINRFSGGNNLRSSNQLVVKEEGSSNSFICYPPNDLKDDAAIQIHDVETNDNAVFKTLKTNSDLRISSNTNRVSSTSIEEIEESDFGDSLKIELGNYVLKLEKKSSSSHINSNRAESLAVLEKMKQLIHPIQITDEKRHFFNSLKLFQNNYVGPERVSSTDYSEPVSLTHCPSNDAEYDSILQKKNYAFNFPVAPLHTYVQTVADIPTHLQIPITENQNYKTMTPQILQDYCILQDEDEYAAENKESSKLKEENCGETLENSSKPTSRNIKKIKSKSQTSKKSLGKQSKSPVINEDADGKQSEINRSFINVSDHNLTVDDGRLKSINEIGASSNFSHPSIDEINTRNIKEVGASKSNSRVVENIHNVEESSIGEIENIELFYDNDFPLINLEKSQLKYEDSTNHIINIDYQSVNKDLRSKFPSVGKILSETMPAAAKAALDRWKKNMIAELGEDGFEKLNKANLERGKLFHDYLSRYLVGESFNDALPDKVSDYFKSLAEVLPHISDVKVVESHVIHPKLHYSGFIDCVAKFRGTPVIIEWKLSEKPKSDIRSTYDAPLQMCAYLGALNYDENYNFPVASGVVVAAYTDGSPANVFFLPEEKCLKYWEGFQNRLQKYQQLKSSQLIKDSIV